MGLCQMQCLVLREPNYPDMVKGFEGLQVAQAILEKYDSVGLLIGGLARLLWSGESDHDVLAERKDVDVVVLYRSCHRHPRQWEGGIDWFVAHKVHEKPTNGTRVGIVWRAHLASHVRLAPGLYLPPRELLSDSMSFARKNGQEIDHEVGEVMSMPLLPVIPQGDLVVRWGGRGDRKARHCKPYEWE